MSPVCCAPKLGSYLHLGIGSMSRLARTARARGTLGDGASCFQHAADVAGDRSAQQQALPVLLGCDLLWSIEHTSPMAKRWRRRSITGGRVVTSAIFLGHISEHIVLILLDRVLGAGRLQRALRCWPSGSSSASQSWRDRDGAALQLEFIDAIKAVTISRARQSRSEPDTISRCRTVRNIARSTANSKWPVSNSSNTAQQPLSWHRVQTAVACQRAGN